MSPPMTYLIDDDAQTLKSLEFLLKALKISYQSFLSAEAFLEVVEDLEEGCIITDYHMPGMSGLELADELLNRGIDWPIILATGRSDATSSVEVTAKKKITLLLKPYQNNDLLDAITKCKNSVRA